MFNSSNNTKLSWFYLLYKWLRKNNKKQTVYVGRKKVNNEAIRLRIKAQGWNLLEVPIKKVDPKTSKPFIARWKIVATKNQRSIEVGGRDIDEALNNIGKTLGVISKDN
jgi:hypothetical protein